VEALDHAAVPTLSFALRVDVDAGVEIRALLLRADIRIALSRRAHDVATRERLAELFGSREQWPSAPRWLTWSMATLSVPAFTGGTTVALPVACTYDFEVTASKYLHGVAEGDVPLDFLFTGTIFYGGEDGRLRTAMVPWDREATFALPVSVWKDLMQCHFGDTAWLRVRREAFDRLWAYKTRNALPTWDDALDALLRASEEPSAWTR
jgi:hypothetical protein